MANVFDADIDDLFSALRIKLDSEGLMGNEDRFAPGYNTKDEVYIRIIDLQALVAVRMDKLATK